MHLLYLASRRRFLCRLMMLFRCRACCCRFIACPFSVSLVDDLALVRVIEHAAEQVVVRALVAEEVNPWATRVACPHVFGGPYGNYGSCSEGIKVVGGCDLARRAPADGDCDWFRVVVEDAAGLVFELFDQLFCLAECVERIVVVVEGFDLGLHA